MYRQRFESLCNSCDFPHSLVSASYAPDSPRSCIVFTDEQLALGDVNKDGYISLVDAIMIQKYALEIISDFD
ncbi:MAG: dockerin type I domain-containing protein [Acutalibacteraceae bacterium]